MSETPEQIQINKRNRRRAKYLKPPEMKYHYCLPELRIKDLWTNEKDIEKIKLKYNVTIVKIYKT